MMKPRKYAIDRASAIDHSTGDRIEVVVLILECDEGEFRFVFPKVDSILIGSGLTEASHDAKRLIDVARGVGG